MMSIFVMCRFSDFKLEVCGIWSLWNLLHFPLYERTYERRRPDPRFILLTGSPSEDAMLSSTVRNTNRIWQGSALNSLEIKKLRGVASSDIGIGARTAIAESASCQGGSKDIPKSISSENSTAFSSEERKRFDENFCLKGRSLILPVATL